MEHSDFLPPPLCSLALRAAVPPHGEGGWISQVPGKSLRTCPGLRPRWVVASGPARGGYPDSLLARRYCLPHSRRRRLPPHPTLSRLNPTPRMTPVYTSDPALPRRPQDSVPACPLRLWPDETFTHRHSSASHDVLPGSGVATPNGASIIQG